MRGLCGAYVWALRVPPLRDKDVLVMPSKVWVRKEMLAALASAPAAAPSPAPGPRTVLFLGPYAKAEVVDDMAKGLAINLSRRLGRTVRVVVGDPPYEVPDDPDSTGYWMRPSHRLPAERRKLLRKQIFSSLTLALTHVVRFEPCLIYGRGQGGVIASLMCRPLVLESACRARILTSSEMVSIRRAWAKVAGVLVEDPTI